MVKKCRRYGDMLRSRREEIGFGLREFADLVGIKASNLSDVENNKKAPHFSAKVQSEILQYLEIPAHTDEWHAYFDAAKREDGEIPKDVALYAAKEEAAVTSLLRTAARKQLTEEQLRQLEEWVNQKWSANTHDV